MLLRVNLKQSSLYTLISKHVFKLDLQVLQYLVLKPLIPLGSK